MTILKLDMSIKLVVFDFDGVFTDGKIYVSRNGDEMKCYNGKDSYGLKLLRDAGIITGLITADSSDILNNTRHILSRLDKVCTERYDKKVILNQWREELGLEWENIAYIGDDLPDLECLRSVGFSACPNNAVPEVKSVCNYICKKNGGEGAVREFVDRIIERMKQ